MSTNEIKAEIQKTLESLPENILMDILSYLRLLKGKTKEQLDSVSNLKKILAEDSELLSKLAE